MSGGALVFVHPDQGDAPVGFLTTRRGQLETLDHRGSVRQALVMLLTTQPGERVMRPDYGAHLHRLAFEPNDETTAGLAMHYAGSAIRRWEPRVEVLAIDAVPNPEAGMLSIDVDYRVLGARDDDHLRVEVPMRDAQ